MKKGLEDIKFNLTQEMSLELIKFNRLKKELNEKKKLYNLNKNETLLLEIKELEKKLIASRKSFITKFQKNNKEEILEYLKYQKDQEN